MNASHEKTADRDKKKHVVHYASTKSKVKLGYITVRSKA